MKKLIITGVFMAFTTIGLGQQNVPSGQDTIQQPLQSTPINGTPQVNDAKIKSKQEFQAVKRAKDKGSTQKATTAERSVSDSVKRPKEPKPQLQHDKPSY